MMPTDRGFDEFFGFLGGGHSYFPGAGKRIGGSIIRGSEPVVEDDYLTLALAREAAEFIARHPDGPFFLYLPFNAVHTPMQAPDEYLQRFAHIKDSRRQTFAAMLSALDDAVGQVLEALAEHVLEQDTLVFFLGDNGGPTAATTCSNGILSGSKGTVSEGGIRVPFFLRWGSRVPAGRTYEFPVISLDVVPTVLAATGAAPGPQDALDGVDLLPYVTGAESARPHARLYWRFGEQGAIRQGDWKLVMPGADEARLYDLAADPGEKRDQFDEEPEIAAELGAAWSAWDGQLMEPLWRGKRRQR
jgi:arylsulfatase A-like enzyme